MQINTIGEKFVHDLGAIYDAEHQFLTAQQDMLAQATSPVVQQMLQEHIMQTRQQIMNIEQIFGMLGATPARASSQTAAGLVADGQDALMAAATPALRDGVIVASAAKVEHFEMACYRGLVADAQQINHPDLLHLLQVNLAQEEATAAKLESNYPSLLKLAIADQKLDKIVGAPVL